MRQMIQLEVARLRERVRRSPGRVEDDPVAAAPVVPVRGGTYAWLYRLHHPEERSREAWPSSRCALPGGAIFAYSLSPREIV